MIHASTPDAPTLLHRAPGRVTSTGIPRDVAKHPVALLGVPFDHVTIKGAVDRIDAMIAPGRPHYVVTANVDFLVQAHRDVELRRILLDADLVLCDGTPLVWASRLMGNPLPERVAGSDLAPALIERAVEKGHRIFLLGAAEGVAAEATAKLKAKFPTLNIVGHYSPPYSALLEMNHADIATRIRAARPDILFVSFGCPKQEKWIAMHHRTLGVPVSIGVGATIDFLAGRVKRAPAWMRRSGTEWIHRLLQEPRRLYKRYATDIVCFVPTFAHQRLRLCRARNRGSSSREIMAGLTEWRGIELGPQLTAAALEHDDALRKAATEWNSDVLVDCSNTQQIDGTGIAFLIRWRKQLHARGRHLILLAPSRTLRRALDALNLTDYFFVAADFNEASQEAMRLATQSPVHRDGMTRSLAWCGEISAANAEDVWRMTTEHVQAFIATDASLIIIDLSRLRFIDSSGAALMLRLKKWSQTLSAEVIFAHPQPNVRNVLRLTRMDQLLLEGAQ